LYRGASFHVTLNLFFLTFTIYKFSFPIMLNFSKLLLL